MSRPIAHPLTLLTIIAMLAGLAAFAPGRAIAGTTTDAPTFEPIATQSVILPDAISGADDTDEELISLAWRSDWLPTLTEDADPVPFAPGFLYSPEAMLLLYRDDGRFNRLRAGEAEGMDGSQAVAPVPYDGEETAFLAIELILAEDATDDTVEFTVPTGEWELTLWRLELPDGAPDPVPLDAAEGDDAFPALVLVTEGEVQVADGADDDGLLTAEDDARTINGPVAVTAGASATVVVVTFAPPGATGATPSRSPRANAGGESGGNGAGDENGSGGGSGDGTGSGSEGGSGTGANTVSSTAPSPSPSAPPVDDTDGDGLLDADETDLGTSVTNPDSDQDGLTDGAEVVTYGTDPLLVDSDGDEYDDYSEIFGYQSDPLVRDTDTDGDRILDAVEQRLGTNLNDLDSDDDCLRDDTELNTGVLDPTRADTDGDGASDLVQYSGDPNLTCVPPDYYT